MKEVVGSLLILALIAILLGCIDHMAHSQAIGFPAEEGRLKKDTVYEVCGQWYEGEKTKLTMVRVLNGQLRLFALNQELEPGFYQLIGPELVPLKANPLTTVSTNFPLAHGESK